MSLRPDDTGRDRSSSRTRSNSRDDRAPSQAAPIASPSDMPGQYRPDLADSDSDDSRSPREERPVYQSSTSQSQGGVRYAPQLENASFTPYAQWGYDAHAGNPSQLRYTAEPNYAQPRGKYSYAEVNHYSYSARPQFVPDDSSPTDSRAQNTSDPLAYGSPPPAQPPYPVGDHSFLPPPPPQPYPGSNSGVPPPPPGPPATGPAYARGANIREVLPPPSPSLRPHRGSTNGPRPDVRAPSPQLGLDTRMDRLSVSGNRPEIHTVVPGGGKPPASPLLEAYRGTFQSMPSPIMIPRADDDLDDLLPLSPRVSRTSVGIRERKESFSRISPTRSSTTIKSKKKVSMYDAETDARDIAEELMRSHPNVQILIDILPTLSHDQILELRAAYKRVAKVQGQGINIAKHIKLKTSGNFQKICYVTALGRWESEGYWANYWYQNNSARRELLIEALMGKSNAEIRNIKDTFKDKRYGDSLSRCMDKELKADKFRVAVLMALEEKRQEENDTWPVEYRNKDVDKLYESLRRRDGGETAILEIVVTRSNNHLKEVLRTYERKYGSNFAKDALKKSNNLVGEIIAHILNGVINRPARDAMLLYHALIDLAPNKEEPMPRSSRDNVSSSSSKADRKDRYELLISRLVRLHWERMHLIRVKEDYQEKYGHSLEEDIEYYVKSENFREFCLGLCDASR